MEWEYIMEVISIQWIDDIPINYSSDTTYYNVKLKLEAPQPGVDPEGSLVLKVRDSMFLVPNGPNEEFFSTQGYFSESCNGISFTGNGCGPLTFECDLSQFHDSILYLKSPFQTGVQ